MAKSKSVLGFDLGGNQIKIVEIKKNKVVKFVKEDMPDGIISDGEITAWETLYEFLYGVISQNRFRAKNARLVLPDKQVNLIRITTPIMSEKQLAVNLPFEFKDFISDDSEAYIYDYALKGITQDENGNDTGYDILACATSSALMDKYIELFDRLHLNLEMATPQCLCIETLMKRINPSLADEDFAVIDLGYSTTRINIFSNGIYDTARTIDTGCRNIVERITALKECNDDEAIHYMNENTEGILDSPEIMDICSDIAINIMRAVNYYAYEKQNNELHNLYVCGGGATIPQLVSELDENVPLNIIVMSEFTDSEMGKDVLVNGHAAAGICWNGGD